MLEILDSIKPYTNFMKVLGCYASSEIQKKDYGRIWEVALYRLFRIYLLVNLEDI